MMRGPVPYVSMSGKKTASDGGLRPLCWQSRQGLIGFAVGAAVVLLLFIVWQAFFWPAIISRNISDRIMKLDTDICSLPADPGKCRGGFRMYFYNGQSQQCEEFLFGGCQDGNANRFATREKCMERCAPTTTASKQEYDAELCDVDECPADCSLLGRRDGCVLCSCRSTTFIGAGEIAVALDQTCPDQFVEVRQDVDTRICVENPKDGKDRT